mmetsp:Transcript_13007/g.17428  ORF Transcript_13007/g.17428 Transcript_13007/m.17428 type:complete len:184 (+) Transcript_13007:165-716(+)
MCKALLRIIFAVCLLAISPIQAEVEDSCCNCNCTSAVIAAGPNEANCTENLKQAAGTDDANFCNIFCFLNGGMIISNTCGEEPMDPIGQKDCCSCDCTSAGDMETCMRDTAGNSLIHQTCSSACTNAGGKITQNCCPQFITGGETGPCDRPVFGETTSASHVTQGKMGLSLGFAGAFVLGGLL